MFSEFVSRVSLHRVVRARRWASAGRPYVARHEQMPYRAMTNVFASVSVVPFVLCSSRTWQVTHSRSPERAYRPSSRFLGTAHRVERAWRVTIWALRRPTIVEARRRSGLRDGCAGYRRTRRGVHSCRLHAALRLPLGPRESPSLSDRCRPAMLVLGLQDRRAVAVAGVGRSGPDRHATATHSNVPAKKTTPAVALPGRA